MNASAARQKAFLKSHRANLVIFLKGGFDGIFKFFGHFNFFNKLHVTIAYKTIYSIIVHDLFS